ncbi:MAG TPA: alpha/beta hydrolase [Verrucomicrobiae bacterium]
MNDVTRKRWQRLIVAGIVCLILFMSLREFEQANVYHPSTELEVRLPDVGIPGEEVWLTTSDKLRLNAWYFPAPKNSTRSRYAVLFAHGNGGNISHRVDIYRVWHGLGVNFLSFDYRGYGLSEGKPSEKGTYQDAKAGYDWLLSKGFQPENIIIFGESLGGGIASWLAAEHKVGALVLQSTYTSVPDLGTEIFPYLPVRLLATIHYNTLERLPKIKVPLLILHSRSDSLIRFHHAEKNYKAANEPKLLHEVLGDHNETLFAGAEQYKDGVEKFLQTLDKSRNP